MTRTWTRRLRRAGGGVCAAIIISATLTASPRAAARHRAPRATATSATKEAAPVTPAPPKFPDEPRTLAETKGAPGLIAFPPKPHSAPRPVTVMLHGMCDEPEYECPWFANTVTDSDWLLCPRASLRCDGGGSIWSFKRTDDTVERSVERAKQEFPGTIDDGAGRTLVGFSLGAIRGMDLAHEGAGRYTGVVLIGAKIFPDARRLRKAGVKRIVLAAGERDMMKWQMVGQARRLARQKFPVAFMSMGPVGHWFPKDMDRRLRRALDWVHGDDGAWSPTDRGELVYLPPKPSAAH